MSFKLVAELDGTTLTTEQLEGLPGAQLQAMANEEVAAFNAFFSRLDNNSDLVGPERALLNTYIWWKTHPAKSGRLPPKEDNAQESSD